jgi:hypothetical protein
MEESINESRNLLDNFEQKVRAELGEQVGRLSNQLMIEKSSREETEEALL